ncbi:FAD-binding oxidoreductase [Mesorhizobium sp. BH1-1-5]|uniref:NAD(P)/FAD-dependent oxidoreductase n=1 Tax=Mesorhizobium sp. BH1-1-5 TaxID=2876661 RepID=UPI001CCA4080|nr:FAD-binding oxidoreductase [Mesorhizobium sp. BH1-1-5]MBZ9991540.1 FAD-binding oxidoreductase [Mesorhizobium sp. BH1-1-5]
MSPDPTQQMHDVAVIGGGIVGLSAALELQSRGRLVIVIDPDDEYRRASYGNAGVLSRGSILPVAGPGIWNNLFRYARNADPAVRLRYSSLPALWPWLRRFLRAANQQAQRDSAAILNPLVEAAFARHIALGEIAGTIPLIHRDGWLRLYRSDTNLAGIALEREILGEHGVETELLSGEAIYELEPFLARRYAHGLLFTQTGSVQSPGEVVRRFTAAFRARGGKFLKGSATGLRQTATGVDVRTRDGVVHAGHAVVSAGAWSGGLLRELGYRIPLASERGYHAHYRLREGASLGRAINDTSAGFVVAPMNGEVRLLTGVELCRPDDPPRPRQLDLAAMEAARTLPLGEAAGPVWSGNRPSTPDSLPVIGLAPNHDRVVLAFGHGHIGFSTGPVTGDIVARLICKERQTIPIAGFDVRRFSQSAAKQ